MIASYDIAVRAAQYSDRQPLSNLIHFGSHVHRHLDWRRALDWLGHQPYLVVERNGRLMAALACPPDPGQVAWIRLFAVSAGIPVSSVWSVLWDAVQERYSSDPIILAAIPMQSWFQDLLASSRFQILTEVVVLAWNWKPLFPQTVHDSWRIREMEFSDLEAVRRVDEAAFTPIWQISEDLMNTALSQSAVATVAEAAEGIIGYQISTANSEGGHLARLAVYPDQQNQGIGSALVRDMLAQFRQVGARRVTVNTQTDNPASLALYEKAGFLRTEEVYPVYQYTLGSESILQ